MEKVKERMKQIKDAIEIAQQRETEAKSNTKEFDSKVDILGGETTTLQSRINVVRAEYEKILERLQESENKLKAAEARNEESEIVRKKLAETEVDDFERSEEIESTLKVAAMSKENANHLVVEAERKVLVLESDITRTQEKYERFTERADTLQEELDNFLSEIRKLEESDRNASEREDASEEKIKFLDTQKHEVLNKSESLEREVVKLEKLRNKLEDEIASWKERREDVLRQMEMEDVLEEGIM